MIVAALKITLMIMLMGWNPRVQSNEIDRREITPFVYVVEANLGWIYDFINFFVCR